MTLCVNPPVVGVPVPNCPVKVKLYVPFAVVLLVCTVTVLFALLDPVSEIEPAEKLQVELAGTPAQESEMLPVKPLSGVTVNLYVVFCPALIA